MSSEADLTNRDLVFCPAACRREGRLSVLRLASVGFLTRLRAVSADCPACGHVTAVSLRKGAFQIPEPGACWNCAIPHGGRTGPGTACTSCGVDPDIRTRRANGVFFTYGMDELGALADEPRDALLARLEAARAEHRLADALAAADALTHREPEDARLWRRKAELYLEHGFLMLALHAWKKALAAEPHDLATVLAFAGTLELLDEIEAALAVTARAAELAPGDAAPLAVRASLLARLESWDEAGASARAAIALDPGRADAWSTLATLHMRARRFGEAAEAWAHVVAAKPDFPLAWRYKGFCHLAGKEWDEALAAGRRAGDGDDDALELVFEAHVGKDDREAALAHAERTVALRPADTRFLYLQARALMALGRHDEGLLVCDAMAAIEPSSDWPKRVRAAFAAKL